MTVGQRVNRPQGVRWRAFRRCLVRNEIFFKTVAATLLSMMAIAVAITQALTAIEEKRIAAEQKDAAVQQKELVRLQTMIAEANALPKFVLGIHQQINPATQHADDNYLVIENNGGEVHELEARAAYFLSVKIGIPNGLDGKSFFFSGEVEFPISGYFSIQTVGRGGTGLLTVMTGHRNNAIVGDIERDARQLADEKRWAYANVDEHIFVYLQYLDILDRRYEVYYSIPGVGGGYRIDEANGKKVFDRWMKFEDHFELEKLTAEKLLSLAYEKLSKKD